ncbi:DNA-binding protein [Massilia eurypsychrophila]|uniref:DNA-binding protein n=1 Tax=Massilia eurypsychrophila TaxID=1485217 RepID=UPI001E559C56|nr:DNA-binding protein [Massilia eurypsychrophila]
MRNETMKLGRLKKGSDGDVQKDIMDWYKGLFALKRSAAIGGVPDGMATLFREVWRGAVEQADHRLEADRAQLEVERAQAAAAVQEAQ